jgi:hypothetical protein
MVKAGSSVPMKFSLGSFQGLDVIAPGYPVARPVSCSESASVNAVDASSTAAVGTGLRYDDAAGQYVYVWKTDAASTGCVRFELKLTDGTLHTALFSFR